MRRLLCPVTYPARLNGEPLRSDDKIFPTTSRGEANTSSRRSSPQSSGLDVAREEVWPLSNSSDDRRIGVSCGGEEGVDMVTRSESKISKMQDCKGGGRLPGNMKQQIIRYPM